MPDDVTRWAMGDGGLAMEAHGQDLHAKVEQLERELSELRGLLIERTTAESSSGLATGVSPVSRRGLLRLAGAGAVGAAAGTVLMASPAGAADPNDVVLGATNSTTTRTDIISSAVDDDIAFNVANNGTNSACSAIEGDAAAVDADAVVGVAFALTGTGSGVRGTASSAAGTGVLGQGASLGTGVTGTASGTGSTGVKGTGRVGVDGTSSGASGIGVRATTGTSGAVAVQANPSVTGSVGFEVNSPGTGVVGVKARGTRAPLLLVAAAGVGAPTGDHEAGELWTDSAGDLYLCSLGGTPGTWTKLNNQGAGVGGLQLVNPPVRVYDSRPGQPANGNPQGTLAFPSSRTINCSSAVPGARRRSCST